MMYDPEKGQYDTNFNDTFTDKNVRLGFIRKVYGILSIQLIITLGFVCVFSLSEGVKKWTAQNSWLLWVALGVVLVTMIILQCCGDFHRKTPHNYICLMIFTFAESFLVGVISSVYDHKVVLAAVCITAVICIGLTLFAFQTKIDFTVFNGLLFVFLLVFVLFGFIMMFWNGPTIRLIYACLGALLFSAFLVVDTQMIVGGGRNIELSEEDYVFAALALYLDIINIFLYILQILQSISNSN